LDGVRDPAVEGAYYMFTMYGNSLGFIHHFRTCDSCGVAAGNILVPGLFITFAMAIFMMF
jgi:hypothetical protein